MPFINVVTIVMLTLIAIIANGLGFDWLNEGHGLHPAIAFSIAATCICIIIGMFIVTHLWNKISNLNRVIHMAAHATAALVNMEPEEMAAFSIKAKAARDELMAKMKAQHQQQ